MSKQAVLRNRFTQTFNKGDFLSAKIYSDVRGNSCACGGKFSSREEFKGYEVPICNSCGEDPNLYRITAKILDIAGKPKRVEIRHDLDGERLRDAVDCMSLLKQIKREIKEGTFDVRRYDSKISKESFLFENFTERYLQDYDKRYKRKEITAGGLKRKKILVLVHLLPFFKGVDINQISAPKIKEFSSSYTDKLRTRDMAIAELKTMLNYALEYELIQRLPKFEKLAKSKKRHVTLTVNEVKRVINKMPEQRHKDMFNLILTYSIRPGELRALQWRDINFKEGTVTFQRHISANEVIEGRKSVSIENPKGRLVRPLTPDVLEILMRQPRSLVDSDFVFPGARGNDRPMSQNTLPRIWNATREKMKLGYVASYEIRHASGTEKYLKHKDIYLISEDLGHTNINTTTRYANVSDEKIRTLYQ